jgi:F420 biosynthesis protein FbiB-like protein
MDSHTQDAARGSARASIDWFGLVAGRRSIRLYRPEPLPSGLVERVLGAMCWAPSAHNRQPWRIALLDDLDSRARLARAMGDRLRADRRADGDPEAAIDQDVARSYARITGAAAVVVLCLDVADMDRYPDERRGRAEFLMAVQSVGMVAQNLLLAAHAEGVGACWMCAPLFCPEVVTGALGLPVNWEPQGLITLGWPANNGKPPTRHSLAEVLWRTEPA